jgi:hypothetical protein
MMLTVRKRKDGRDSWSVKGKQTAMESALQAK